MYDDTFYYHVVYNVLLQSLKWNSSLISDRWPSAVQPDFCNVSTDLVLLLDQAELRGSDPSITELQQGS